MRVSRDGINQLGGRNELTQNHSSPKSAMDGEVQGRNVRVRMEVYHPTAMAICIAGDFNDWRGGTTPMQGLSEGWWVTELFLPPGTYEYLLIADGEWFVDPGAMQTVPNSSGSINCVLRVLDPEQRPISGIG